MSGLSGSEDAGAARQVKSIPVFYCDEMLAVSDCRSPSAAKPRPVVEAWQQLDLPIDLRPIMPASFEQLSVAHNPTFVEMVLMCLVENGFRNTRTDVARSLPYTNGAMLNAARAALTAGVACAPTGGFHHAGYETASMFCTFNGLMVAALNLLNAKLVGRVLILDCDFHYGNGTDDIIDRLGVGDVVENATFGRTFCAEAQAAAYFKELERQANGFSAFDLILYQAGADVHVDDPLGGIFTSEQMRERDRLVFEAAKRTKVPLAWNLAGGYQEPLSEVVALHVATMEECVRAYLQK